MADNGQLDDTGHHDVMLIAVTVEGERKFMGVCRTCGERSDPCYTAGMIWGWEDAHKRGDA